MRGAADSMFTAVHLALREMLRNWTRYLLFSLVVALITVLVLFVAALGSGLLGGISEYFEALDADLLVYQDTARRVASSSRVGCDARGAIRNVDGVRDVGGLAFSSVSIVQGESADLLDISLVGVEPGKPGEPPVVAGQGLRRKQAREAIIDGNVAQLLGLQPGDRFTVSTVQGGSEEFYTLRVLGISESLRYNLSPSVFVPLAAWDEIRPKALVTAPEEDPACNVVAVQLDDPTQIEAMSTLVQGRVENIEAVDPTTAYESQPGYTSIRSSLAIQRTFALLISGLVIGGFFQIQTLQKVPQIGMLKAIGTPNHVVALATLIEILLTMVAGVAIASPLMLGIASSFPASVPIVFDLRTTAMAVGSIFLMGFLGGLLSIRYSLRVEPLIALGLGA
ncbi:MAG TPA: ABC transporter permease [Anaerolineae bacterium]|nr:ABC transporter permease [Anaerolineae bacterium]